MVFGLVSWSYTLRVKVLIFRRSFVFGYYIQLLIIGTYVLDSYLYHDAYNLKIGIFQIYDPSFD